MSHRNLLLLLGAVVISYACYVRAEQNPYARYVAAGFSIIDRWALENAPDEELFNAAMDGMVDVLHKYGDEHSEFIDASRQAAFNEEYRAGVRRRRPAAVAAGRAAAADGHWPARAGHAGGRRRTSSWATAFRRSTAKSTAGVTLEKVTDLVRGPKGTPVTLSILRPGETTPRTVDVQRDVITVESVLGDVRGPDGRWNYVVSEQPRIGYARIDKFGDKTAAEARRR